MNPFWFWSKYKSKRIKLSRKSACPGFKQNLVDIGENSKRIPETMRFSNSPTFDVDVSNQIIQKCDMKLKSRWTLNVFFSNSELAGWMHRFCMKKRRVKTFTETNFCSS